MKVCRELEKQFGLVPTMPKQWKEGLPLSPVDYENGNLKGQLAGVIRPVAREWRFRTLGEYRTVLSLYGITVDEVKGEYGGQEYHGLTYSATDREGNKIGKPFKSSVFGKETGSQPSKGGCTTLPHGKRPTRRSPPPCRPQGMTGRSSSGNSCGRASVWYLSLIHI